MRTKKQLIEDVEKLMETDEVSYNKGQEVLSIRWTEYSDVKISMKKLEELAELCESREINFNHYGGSPGYSEWTPSSPGNFSIAVHHPKFKGSGE